MSCKAFSLLGTLEKSLSNKLISYLCVILFTVIDDRSDDTVCADDKSAATAAAHMHRQGAAAAVLLAMWPFDLR